MASLNPAEMLGALMVAHVVCDYPLQGDFLARAKSRAAPIPYSFADHVLAISQETLPR